jgi:hypothetical protein
VAHEDRAQRTEDRAQAAEARAEAAETRAQAAETKAEAAETRAQVSHPPTEADSWAFVGRLGWGADLLPSSAAA